MIEFKISCWIVEIYVVLLGSDKIMFILKRWIFRVILLYVNKYRNILYQYSIIFKDLYVIIVILM